MSPVVHKKKPPAHPSHGSAAGKHKHKQKHTPAKGGKAHAKHPKLTAAQLAAKEIYPNERSPYKAIPASKQGPGKLTGGHTITIQAWTQQLSVTCLLGAAGGKLTGGFGNWQQVAIPRGDPLTQWTGRSLFTMDLDLLFDGWHKQTTVEPAIAKLEAMARRIPASLTPPPLRLYGAVPLAARKWVISGIDYGDALRSFKTGARLRQEVTVHLIEYREETALANLPRAAATAKPPRKYKVKKGDTLKTIATKLLGKSALWPSIAKLNKGLRGFKIPAHFVGKTILVPQKGAKPKHDRNDGSHPKKNTPAKKK
jgi:nucleoid-associated protein YgaU